MTAVKQTPEARAKRTASCRETWSDPALRAEQSARITAACSDPAVRARKSAAAVEVNSRPGQRELHQRNTSNLVWVTDGKINTRVPRDQPVPIGFSPGRCTFWITDGVTTNRMHVAGNELPDGFRPGRTLKPISPSPLIGGITHPTLA